MKIVISYFAYLLLYMHVIPIYTKESIFKNEILNQIIGGCSKDEMRKFIEKIK